MEVQGVLSNTQIQLGLATGIASLLILYKVLTTKKPKLPPGPTGWPVIGNLYDIMSHKAPIDLLQEYRQKYGNLFTIYMGRSPTVVVSGLENIREAFVDKQNDFAGRPLSYSMDLFTDGGKSAALGDYTEEWKIQRKIAHSALRKYAGGKQLEDLVHDSFDKLTTLLEKQKDPVDPMRIISLLVFNIIANMTFGKNWELDDPFFTELVDSLEELNKSFGIGLLADFIPIFKYIPTRGKTRFIDICNKIKKFLKDTMDEHRKNYNPDRLNDLTDYLIWYEDEAKTEYGSEAVNKLDELHYIHLLSDMFFAGTDTSRLTLLWVILLMANNPDCQKKLQKEIDDVVGKQPVLLTDRVNLPYTNAVLHESMRYKIIAPISLPRKTTCDTSIKEYIIPKGTEVWPNLYSLHNDKGAWKNADKFDVSHFLDDDGNFTGIPPHFKPFGTGRRVCIGESLAKNELHMLVAMLFQRFSVASPDGKPINEEFREQNVFGMPKPFEIVFTKRSQ